MRDTLGPRLPAADEGPCPRELMSAPDPILDRLLHLHPKKIDLSLDRMKRLLAALGDPQTRLPPVIHVAGTNGKGSTIAFMRAILEAAGLGVHVYTSPHLVRFNERIRLADRSGGKLVSDEALSAAFRSRGSSQRRLRPSLFSKPPRLRRSNFFPSIPPTCFCWRSAWAAASTPPTSSTSRPAR